MSTMAAPGSLLCMVGWNVGTAHLGPVPWGSSPYFQYILTTVCTSILVMIQPQVISLLLSFVVMPELLEVLLRVTMTSDLRKGPYQRLRVRYPWAGAAEKPTGSLIHYSFWPRRAAGDICCFYLSVNPPPQSDAKASAFFQGTTSPSHSVWAE